MLTRPSRDDTDCRLWPCHNDPVAACTLIALSVGLLPATAPVEPEPLAYLGSFTRLRTTGSGNVYEPEFWLWQSCTDVVGLYLDFGGLDGDGRPSIVEPIEKGVWTADGSVSLETRFYRFDGRLEGDCLEGVLRQGSRVIRGGVKGSGAFTLCPGTSFLARPSPGASIKDSASWHDWLIYPAPLTESATLACCVAVGIEPLLVPAE